MNDDRQQLAALPISADTPYVLRSMLHVSVHLPVPAAGVTICIARKRVGSLCPIWRKEDRSIISWPGSGATAAGAAALAAALVKAVEIAGRLDRSRRPNRLDNHKLLCH